jgi:hypothetical protein
LRPAGFLGIALAGLAGGPMSDETGVAVPLSPGATAGMKSLQNAKFLEDLGKVTYPASITPPDATMNGK